MRKGKRFRKTKRPAVLLVSMILVLTVAVGGTLAYLVTQTGDVKNTFTVEQVPISVVEEFDGNTKPYAKIKHDGDSATGRDAYVRAEIVANWIEVNASGNPTGNVYSTMPEKGASRDYNFILNSDDWEENTSDGYYYYKEKLEAGGTTESLFNGSCTLDNNNAPTSDTEGYEYVVSVEILAQSIQADGKNSEGKTPVELAWGKEAAKAVGAIN